MHTRQVLGPVDATHLMLSSVDDLAAAARSRYDAADPVRAAIDDLVIRAHEVRRLVEGTKEIVL